MTALEADLLHYAGEAPEGPWAIFSEPGGAGYRLISVLVPRTLWMTLTRRDPFTSEIQILEQVGRRAITSIRARDGHLPAAIWVTPDMIDVDLTEWGEPWSTMCRCGQCGQTVPSGEVAEGLKNALPPNARGETEVLVLCPLCLVQTPYWLTPFGARRRDPETHA